MKIPLIGVPRHAWKRIREAADVTPGLILWRILLLIALTFLTVVVWSATGGSGLTAIILGFAITSLLSYALRDDLLAVWKDLWNARWGEVEV